MAMGANNEKKMCSVKGCNRPMWAGGLCSAHYSRLRRHGDAKEDMPIKTYTPPLNVRNRKNCAVLGCDRIREVGYFCKKHYLYNLRHGHPDYEYINKGKICKEADCSNPAHLKGYCKHHYGVHFGNEMAKKLRNKRKKSGICVVCEVKLKKSDNNYCRKCLDKMNDRVKELSVHRRKHNLCVACGHRAEVKADKNTYCKKCYMKKLSIYTFRNVKQANAIEEMFEKQQYRCAYSGREIVLGENNALDHKTPTARNGKDTIENLCWADREINVMKKDLLPDELLYLCKKVVENAKKGM